MEIFKLYCEKTFVGFVKEPFLNDDTWYGIFETVIVEPEVDFEKSVLYFIDFSKDWNYKLTLNNENPPDASEFDQFNDFINNCVWSIEKNEGNHYKISKAPIFYDNEISWRIEDSL